MKDFLIYLVTNLVDHPDDVAVEETVEEGFTNLQLTVNKEDMGKVIGKEGRIIRALRDLVKVMAIKNNLRANVTLSED